MYFAQDATYVMAVLSQIHYRFPEWTVWRDSTGTWSATRPAYGGLKGVESRSHLNLVDQIIESDGVETTRPIAVQRSSQ